MPETLASVGSTAAPAPTPAESDGAAAMTPVSPLTPAGTGGSSAPAAASSTALMRYWGTAGAQLVFDAVVEEVHETELKITDNPVETGVAVSDHAYMDPVRITMTVSVSNDMLHDVPGSTWDEAQRASDAFAELQKLQQSAVPFDVQTGLLLYHNMVVRRLSTPQDKDTSRILLLQAELRQVIFANTRVADVPASGSTNQMAPPVYGGNLGSEPVVPPGLPGVPGI